MRSVLLRAFFILAFAAAGAALAPPRLGTLSGAAAGLLAGLACFAAELSLRRLASEGLAAVAKGLGAGLAFALLASLTVAPWLEPRAAAFVSGLLLLAGTWLGGALAVRQAAADVVASAQGPAATLLPKLVDTSVIIDGRIADVIATGFVEGRVILPHFVLRELQHVADSSDPLKRNRGRKGLDILRVVQESKRVQVEVTDRDFPDVKDVDGKLLLLAEEMGASILTNDYNLNKVAQLRGIKILNVNDLANSVKPVVLPGETLTLLVIKEGKERNQGVGYLDDGTMVVVDNGKRLIGQTVEAVVSSVIQTNAGKMIFCASPDEDGPSARPRPVRRSDLPVAPTGTIGEG